MKRAEFSKRTKIIVWNRAAGQCERCTAKLYPGRFEYHHKLEATFNGESTVENAQLVCIACHEEITSDRAPVIAKSNRVRAKYIGYKKPRSIRAWRKFNGTPVFATRER